MTDTVNTTPVATSPAVAAQVVTEPNVAPYFETADSLGLPITTWIAKAAKSKTIWFSTAVTVVGITESLLPKAQDLLGSHYGLALTIVGIVGAVLRFTTTKAIADK